MSVQRGFGEDVKRGEMEGICSISAIEAYHTAAFRPASRQLSSNHRRTLNTPSTFIFTTNKRKPVFLSRLIVLFLVFWRNMRLTGCIDGVWFTCWCSLVSTPSLGFFDGFPSALRKLFRPTELNSAESTDTFSCVNCSFLLLYATEPLSPGSYHRLRDDAINCCSLCFSLPPDPDCSPTHWLSSF